MATPQPLCTPQILDLASEEQRLTPWASPHKGSIASVQVHPETKVGVYVIVRPDVYRGAHAC